MSRDEKIQDKTNFNSPLGARGSFFIGSNLIQSEKKTVEGQFVQIDDEKY